MSLREKLFASTLAVSFLTAPALTACGEQQPDLTNYVEINPDALRADLPDQVRDMAGAVIRIVVDADNGYGRYTRDGNAIRTSYAFDYGQAPATHYLTTANTLVRRTGEVFAHKCGSVSMTSFTQGSRPDATVKAVAQAEIYTDDSNLGWLEPKNDIAGPVSPLTSQTRMPKPGDVLWVISRPTPEDTATPVKPTDDVPLRIASLVYVGGSMRDHGGYYVANGRPYEGVNPIDAAREPGAGIFYGDGGIAHLVAEQQSMSAGQVVNRTGTPLMHNGRPLDDNTTLPVVQVRYPQRDLAVHIQERASPLNNAC